MIALDDAAKELFGAIIPLLPPRDYMVWAEPGNDCLMVGTEEIAFTVRRKAINDNVHIEVAKAVLPHLFAAVEAATDARRKALVQGLTVVGG